MRLEIVIWLAASCVLVVASALGVLACCPVVMVVVPAVLFAGGCLLAYHLGPRPGERMLVYRALFAFGMALVVLTQLPLRLGFAVSESRLSALARGARDARGGAGDARVSLPARAGLYVIREIVAEEDGNIYLGMAAGGRTGCGFVFGEHADCYHFPEATGLMRSWWFVNGRSRH